VIEPTGDTMWAGNPCRHDRVIGRGTVGRQLGIAGQPIWPWPGPRWRVGGEDGVEAGGPSKSGHLGRRIAERASPRRL